MRRASEPSFARCIARANRYKESPYVRALLDKGRMRELSQLLGGRVPRLIARLSSITELEPPHLREPVIIKPQRSSNNRGVLPLIPVDEGRWFNPLQDETLNFDEVLGRSALALRRELFDDEWVVEELVQPADDPLRPVDDVKLCFVGDRFVCGFVRRQRPRGFRWFDDTLDSIDPGVHSAQIDSTIPLPRDLDEHVAVARGISSAIPIPFLRVDLYPSATGPVVGELTPLPGWYASLTDEWDLRLGGLVEAEEARLTSRGMDWKGLTDDGRVYESAVKK